MISACLFLPLSAVGLGSFSSAAPPQSVAGALVQRADSQVAVAVHPEGGLGNGSLAAFFDEPDAYLEFLDLRALGEQVGRSSLGAVLRSIEPLQGLGIGATADGHSVQLHPFAGLKDGGGLGSGFDLWDALVRQIVQRLGPDALGLDDEQIERIAAAGGERISYVFRAGEPWEETPAAWAMAWSLQPGGADALEAELLPALQRFGSDRYKLTPEPGTPESGGTTGAQAVGTYRLEGPGVGTTWLVLREELLGWTADADLAEELRRTARPRGDTPFHRARREALARGQSAWVWAHAPALTRRLAFDDDDARSLLSALGLNDIGDVSLGIEERGGQLTSQLELRREGHSGLHGLIRGAPCAWRSLGALTADTLIVAGMPRSPRDVAHELTELALWADSDYYRELRQHWRAMERVPVLGAAFEPDALGAEFVLFARPTLGVQPLVYLATPMSPGLVAHFAGFEAKAEAAGGELRLEGGGAVVERVVRDESTYWVARHDSFDHVAWALVDDFLVLTEDARALRAYLIARQRERLADRESAVAAVWAGLQGCFQDLEDGAYERAGFFLHARTGLVVERFWPVAMLGLRMQLGEAADELPTAQEFGALMGESTAVIIDRPHELEWRGRGLLSGLLLVF